MGRSGGVVLVANLVVRVEEGAVRIEHDGLEAARGRPEARQQCGDGGRHAGQQQQDGRAHGAQDVDTPLMVALGTKKALTWRKGVNSNPLGIGGQRHDDLQLHLIGTLGRSRGTVGPPLAPLAPTC